MRNLNGATAGLSDGVPDTLRYVPARRPNAALRARIELLANLLLLAGTAAASLEGSVADRDRLHGPMITSALDEAMSELRHLSTALIGE